MTVSALVEVEAGAARLEADEEDVGVAALERVDAPLRDRASRR